MENIREILDIKLLSQSFSVSPGTPLPLESARIVAQLYTSLESGIGVLSDMKARKSYLYYGAIAEKLGLRQTQTEINSIWEDELLDLVHPEDLRKKYRLELRFFQFLNSVAIADRSNYEVITKLKVRSSEGKNILLKHRLLYITSSADGSIWLALCLYNVLHEYPGFDAPD